MGLRIYRIVLLVREAADIVLEFTHKGRTALVFMQLKNASPDLDSIRRRGAEFEKIIGHYDPRTRSIQYANKGQLLILSGFFERTLYRQHYNNINNICHNTFIACNELPSIRYFRQEYLYGRGATIQLPRSLRRSITENISRTLFIYIYSVTLNNNRYVIADRSSDLFYTMIRAKYMPYRLLTLEQITWSYVTQAGLATTTTDITNPISYFDSQGIDWKIKGITLFKTTRPLEAQLQVVLRERNLIDTAAELTASANYYGTRTTIGQALINIMNRGAKTGRLGSSTDNILIEWAPRRNEYRIEDLQIGTHISKEEYYVETEGLDRTLMIKLTY